MPTSQPAPTAFADKSFWLASAPYTPNPPLTGDVAADVVVLGGGYTGLATAYFLKKAEPALRVVLLEAEVIGFGASGRNGGFSMTLFGLTLSVTAALFSKEKAREAHHYMEQAVELVESLVREHKLECEYERPGFLRVATTPLYAKRIREEVELAQRLGLEGIDWIEAEAARREVDSPLYLGAWREPRCGLVNPAKLAWELKRLIVSMGVQVYEHTPGTSIERRADGLTVHTPQGKVACSKLALATNAYSHLIPMLRRKQVPAFTHIVLTEPLRPEHFAQIGWAHRQGIEDARNLVHYYRLTRENRLLMGGRDVSLAIGGDMNRDENPITFAKLEDDVRQLFPALRDIRFTHRWGGPVSVPMQMIPALGYLGDSRVAYSLGCMGHGVSLTHLNGWTLADLLLEKKSERTQAFFVNRRVIPWPPEPLRLLASLGILGYMHAEDAVYDRGMGAPSGA
jgi:glycine/D-amino acid oxidase-like deaminating enzyme